MNVDAIKMNSTFFHSSLRERFCKTIGFTFVIETDLALINTWSLGRAEF